MSYSSLLARLDVARGQDVVAQVEVTVAEPEQGAGRGLGVDWDRTAQAAKDAKTFLWPANRADCAPPRWAVVLAAA